MIFTTVTSEGNLISAELLDRIAAGEATGQAATDFNLDKTRRVTDEIAAAWTEARDYWRAFQQTINRLPESDPATGPTRERWVRPLLDVLSYGEVPFMPAAAADAAGRKYAISHRAGSGEEAPPVHIEGFRRSLDKRSESGRPRLSPHALVQEYLNATEHLWGIVTNGAQMRLLRDSSRTSRPTYVEFDLAGIMGGEKFADFALLYRLLHRTRLPQTVEDAPRSLLEQYHQEAIEAGGRVREKLRDGVEAALLELGEGLLAGTRNGKNNALLDALQEGRLSATDYYRQLLRLVYRLLFLMVAEERKLIGGDEAGQGRYMAYYGVTRLRHLAEQPVTGRARHEDLWLGLLATFRALEDDQGARALGISALDGDLFGPTAIPHLMDTHLANTALLRAIRALTLYQDTASKTLRRVNYSALDVEELGSVYESLLDLRPVVSEQQSADPSLATHHFTLVAGTERRTTGSYYTRPELVQELIKSALEPVLAERLAAVGSDSEARGRAILAMTVCDPACGSGHFLLAAARRLGRELARARYGEDQPSPEHFRRAVRDVIAHCIYGVDLNPLAVDLCKVALWIESFDAGLPLSFLDHHIRWGNSLVGATRELVEAGIPDEAYTAVTGDDRATAAMLKKRNKQARETFLKSGAHQRALAVGQVIGDLYAALAVSARRLDSSPGDTVDEIRHKAAEYDMLRSQTQQQRTLYNLWTAAFFLPIASGAAVPTTDTIRDYMSYPGAHPQLERTADKLADELGVFHWELEYPLVFHNGGFDVVLGNPPWERIKLQDEEHWADDSYIRDARNKAERDARIAEYRRSNDPRKEARVARYDAAKHAAEAESKLVRHSGRFQLTGVGDVNTYALFAELARLLIHDTARAGIIVPTGIATDNTTRVFFSDLVKSRRLVSLVGFENEAFIFPDVHNEFKFCALTVAGRLSSVSRADFVFFCRYFDQADQRERHFELSPEDLMLFNPNTGTCPVFRTNADAELAKHLYRSVPILQRDEPQENHWQISFLSMFHMANDSKLFSTKEQLEKAGYVLRHNSFSSQADTYLPLYEAKMIWQFDHRFASLIGRANAGSRPSRKYEGWYGVEPTNSEEIALPSYWVQSREVDARLADRWYKGWFLGFRDVTNGVVERTAVFSLLPRVGVNHKTPLILFDNLLPEALTACFLACVNSLVLDFCVRQKIGGTSLSFFILKQVPVLPPSAFSHLDTDFISDRVLELVYTAWDIKAFADDLWGSLDNQGRDRVRTRWAANHGNLPPSGDETPPPFKWDEERRELIRAELDARIARLYGLTRDELRYILDPADVYGPGFPGETFRVLKEKEQKRYGEYRTRRLVLEAWDKDEAAGYKVQAVNYQPQPATAQPARTVAETKPAFAAGRENGGSVPHEPAPPPVAAPRTAVPPMPVTRQATPQVDGGAANYGESAAGAPGFGVGDRVRHPIHGEGRVVAVQAGIGDQRLSIEFASGRKGTFDPKLARLEKL